MLSFAIASSIFERDCCASIWPSLEMPSLFYSLYTYLSLSSSRSRFWSRFRNFSLRENIARIKASFSKHWDAIQATGVAKNLTRCFSNERTDAIHGFDMKIAQILRARRNTKLLITLESIEAKPDVDSREIRVSFGNSDCQPTWNARYARRKGASSRNSWNAR